MTAADVVRLARERGIELVRDGDQVRYRAPSGALTHDLLVGLQRHKLDVLTLLTPRPTYACEACSRFSFSEPTTCRCCRTLAEVDA